MAIKQSNRDLPRGSDSPGNPPDANPRIGQLLARAWGEINEAEFHRRSREDVELYIRLGWGGKCARDIGYQLLGVPKSNPPDLAGEWRMGLGTMVHEGLQAAVQKAFPGAEVEKVVDAQHDEIFGFPVSGRTDLFLVEGGYLHPNERGEDQTREKRVAVEVKTINGFGFKKCIGARGPAEGPRTGAIFQGALNARAHDADELVIVLLSLECLGDREFGELLKKQGGEPDPVRKFVAEWSYDRETLNELVDREIARLAKIVDMAKAVEINEEFEVSGPLPPRSIPLEMPPRARVVDPTKGSWVLEIEGEVVQAGDTWWCGYCDFRDRCIADGAS